MKSIDSKALEANLVLTKHDVYDLPDNHEWLLKQSEEYYGIHQRTKNFFKELYHPYLNVQYVIDLFQQTILNDLWFYFQLGESTRALQEILRLFIAINKLKLETAHKKRLLTSYLDFVESLAQNKRDELIDEAIKYLLDWSKREHFLFAYSGAKCRKTALALQTNERISKLMFGFVKVLYRNSLEYWEENSNTIEWLISHNIAQNQYEKLDPVLGKTFYDNQRSKLERAKSLDDLSKILSYQDIVSHYRQAIDLFLTLSDKIQYIFYLLSLDGMADIYEFLLWDLNKFLSEISTMDSEEARTIINAVFKKLQDFRSTHPSIVLDCVLTIGKAISNTENDNLFQESIDHIVNIGFIGPGKVKIDDNWQISINKNHLKNIRAWFTLISIDPLRFKDLLAALTVDLIQKGVFVFDTDLFQKDVSNFLNSNIESCYIQVKHLLRLFPVFFNEIGAEGEIRELTTNIDEMTNRNDRLMHYLRKQVHIESNNTHVLLTEKIIHYWYDLDAKHLKSLIPKDVLEYVKQRDELQTDTHEEFNDFLKRKNLKIDSLLQLPKQEFVKLFKQENIEENVNLRRIYLLCKLYYLLLEKYHFDSFDVIQILKRSQFYAQKDYVRFYRSLLRKDYESGISLLFDYISKLNEVILDPKPSSGWENIYHKRHIAAGIPSVYGQYREPKFEAIGLIFRMESVIGRLIERYIKQINLSYITAKTLKRIIRVLDIFYRGLQLENINNEGLHSTLHMLKFGYRITNLSIGQYIDIFNRLKDSINEIINEYYYRFYEYTLYKHIHNSLPVKAAASTSKNTNTEKQVSHFKERKAEEFYRELLSSSFLVQEMDGFVSQILTSLKSMVDMFTREQIDKVMSYDPDMLVVSLTEKNLRWDNQILLGSKAYFLRRMHNYNLPTPPGIVVTTELYRHRSVIRTHPQIHIEYEEMIQQNVKRLEGLTGLKYGDYKKPLLLSVRSGAPMSLPGAMNTFLNVGMNDEITENLSKQKNFGWTAWDCYRRLIQSWGMSYGIPRDDFDNLMLKYKKRFNIAQKTEFSPVQMRELVFDYKKILEQYKVKFEEAPFQQLKSAIVNVLDSWNSDRAKLYRQKLNIADDWGTAIIIQKMVFGNISLESGSGVLFTYSERSKNPGINLNGDFTICSQGEDVVAGLVYTLPISEEQRKTMSSQSKQSTESLEKLFPQIYNRLLRYAHKLIEEHGYPHQEIEFTFEGPTEDQLFLLQTRDQIIRKKEEYTVFNLNDKEYRMIGNGIGINKGAINGHIAFSHEDIEKLKQENLTPLILVRPDTVPDDMDLLFECQGLLTSRGGVTSHAAVTASHLGIIGIVNCRDLIVNEAQSYCTLGDLKLKAGDKIAIDGNSGNIYLGHYPIEHINY